MDGKHALPAGDLPAGRLLRRDFFSTQPALNYGYYERTRSWQQSPEDEGPRATLEEMKNVMRFWLGLGCDGFRVDMAGSLVKNDPEGKGTMALWRKVRAFLDEEFPEAAIISEWGEPDKSLPGGLSHGLPAPLRPLPLQRPLPLRGAVFL